MTKLPISRANLANKRRFVIYTNDLIDYVNTVQSDNNCRDDISQLLQRLIHESKLRDSIDWTYNTKRQDTALSLGSTQILLAIYATKEQKVWDVIHQITDFLQGISHGRRND